MLDVTDFGARGDGATNDARSIDAAIEACAAAGGGTVHVPAGRYRAGTIHLRDNVTLDISPGATLATSPDDDDVDGLEDLPYNPHADAETTYFAPALLRLDRVHDVCIQGGGTIDGNRRHRLGPKPIAGKQCTRVTIRDVQVVNAPNYALSFIDSEHLTISNVIVTNAHADGIDFDGCRFARVSNCHVSSVDDALCLKASPAMGRPIDCAHVLVTNSTFLSEYTAFKIGSETGPGNVLDVAMSNCTLGRRTGSTNYPGGITIASLDGARVGGLAFANIVMHYVGTPVNVKLGKRGRAQEKPVPGVVEDVSVTNLVALDALSGCSVEGLPERRVRHVSFNDVLIHLAEHVRRGRDNDGVRRECVFTCRHAERVTGRNYRVAFPPGGPEILPVARLDDVEHCTIEMASPPSGLRESRP